MAKRSQESRDRGIWTRINNCAFNDRMTIEEFAAQDDRTLMHTPNFGKVALKALRERYGAK